MRIFLIVVALLALATFAYADDTSGATWTSPNGEETELAEWLNGQDYIDHTHEYDKPNYSAGIGADLIVYENKDVNDTILQKLTPDNVKIEQKYDISNNNGSTYVVASYNIWEMFQKKDK